LGIDLIIKKMQSHQCLAKSSNEKYVPQMGDVFLIEPESFKENPPIKSG